MLNVFVCTEHCELLARLIALQDQKQDFHIQGFSSSASVDLAFLAREEIAVIYVQFSLIEQRWRQWLDALQTLRSDRSIHLILSFSSLNEAHMAILLRYSIDDYLLEPFDVRQLYALLHRRQDMDTALRRQQEEMEGRITALLLGLMIPSHLNGFHYLKTACSVAISLPISRQVVMKNIYSITARRCHSTSSRVEKCIRSAIHAADMPNSYLQLFHGDPTSRKVIMYVYTYLKGIV